jgi:hypothetical protein
MSKEPPIEAAEIPPHMRDRLTSAAQRKAFGNIAPKAAKPAAKKRSAVKSAAKNASTPRPAKKTARKVAAEPVASKE